MQFKENIYEYKCVHGLKSVKMKKKITHNTPCFDEH